MYYSVRPATRFDALNMASRLRQEDEREIRSASGRDPSELLPEGVTNHKAFVLEVSIEQFTPGRLLALFGVTTHPTTPEVGIPWLVATPLIKHHQMYFLRRFSRQQVARLGEGYKTLVNCVDARNELHLKWLKWCGFTFTKLHTQWGADQLPFYQVEKQTHV